LRVVVPICHEAIERSRRTRDKCARFSRRRDRTYTARATDEPDGNMVAESTRMGLHRRMCADVQRDRTDPLVFCTSKSASLDCFGAACTRSASRIAGRLVLLRSDLGLAPNMRRSPRTRDVGGYRRLYE